MSAYTGSFFYKLKAEIPLAFATNTDSMVDLD